MKPWTAVSGSPDPAEPRREGRKPSDFAVPDAANPKLTDFRSTPPVVEDISLKRLSAGKSLLMATLAPDKRFGREITLHPDGRSVVLRDDGRLGDERAGDRVFSGVVPMNFDAVAAQQEHALAAIGSRPIPSFAGREIVKTERLDPSKFVRRPNGILHLIPVNGGSVEEEKSLVVTDVSVVEDPTRTTNPCPPASPPTPPGPSKKWSFGYLMEQMANQSSTGINPSDFTLRWLKRWMNTQSVNGFDVSARTAMQNVIDRWPKLSDGRLGSSPRAPVRDSGARLSG
jgi:hypothetical protein